MPLNRRKFLLKTAAAGSILPELARNAFAAEVEPPAKLNGGKQTAAKTLAATNKGLAYLARKQIRNGRAKGAFGSDGYSGGVAVCSLGGLAYLCGGNPQGQGRYGKNVEHCVNFILKNVQDSGYISIGGRGQDSMYGHGFSTLFLSEAYGMSMDSKMENAIGEKLRLAVKLIVETQNSVGGWRYQPRKSDADLSITICQIMALRAAHDAGIDVPDATRKLCIEYVKKSQNNNGGFRYQIRGGSSSFPLTAAGLLSLYSAGIYDGPEITKGLKYLMKFLPRKGAGMNSGYFFYGHYYAVQAMWHAGGDYWQRWYPAIRDQLLTNQAKNGSWTDTSIGPEFGTAMACIILQMPNNFLPVFAP